MCRYARVEVGRDGIPFRSRRNQFVYQICLPATGASVHLRRFLYWEFDRLAGRYFSFCDRQGLPSGRSVAADESAIIGRVFGEIR